MFGYIHRRVLLHFAQSTISLAYHGFRYICFITLIASVRYQVVSIQYIKIVNVNLKEDGIWRKINTTYDWTLRGNVSGI